MKIKRLKKITINSCEFSLTWDSGSYNACFDYSDYSITIGTKSKCDHEIFALLCHEISELCAIEMGVRLQRPDCRTDYIFVYDHRQHDTMNRMFSGAISQFIGD